jgi:hypothetical protein
MREGRKGDGMIGQTHKWEGRRTGMFKRDKAKEECGHT